MRAWDAVSYHLNYRLNFEEQQRRPNGVYSLGGAAQITGPSKSPALVCLGRHQKVQRKSPRAERQILTMRMSVKRFTGSTNRLAKKKNYCHPIALYLIDAKTAEVPTVRGPYKRKVDEIVAFIAARPVNS
jgi:hypothetical protein